MATISGRDSDESEDEQPSLPDDAEHIVVTGTQFGGPEPDGFPDDEVLSYERGDELPFDKTVPHFAEHTTILVALDGDGNVVAGGEEPDPRLGGFTSPKNGLDEALQIWRKGEGFDPNDYEPESD